MSDAGADAATRVTHAVTPYLLTTGVTIANDWADLTDGSLAAPITADETGATVISAFVWTGTDTDGTIYDPQRTCADWTTSAAGDTGEVGLSQSNATSIDWTRNRARTCDLGARHFCFQD